MNKRTIISIILGIIILLVFVSIITYAYYASQITNNAIVDIETGFDMGRVTFIASGTDDLSMYLFHTDLMKVEVDEIAKNVSSNVNISLLANSTNSVGCTYDIVWNWAETETTANRYTKTTGATKEYTVYGSDGVNIINERQVPNYVTGNLSTVIYSGNILNNSATTPTTQTWAVGANFYNLALLQDLVATGNYVSNITVENVSCIALPTNFQQNYELLSYLQSSGTQCIDTGYIVNSENVNVNIKYEYTQVVNTILGSRNSSSIYTIVPYAYSSNSTLKSWVGGSAGILTTNVLPNTMYNTSFNATNGTYTQTINGVSTSTTYANSIQNGISLALFCRKNNTSFDERAYIKVYSFSIRDNGVLVSDMIPAKRISDNVVGMYDLKRNEFYTNVGSGTFLSG